MPTLKNNEEIKFKANESLPLLFADIVRVSARKDGMILVQFAAATPGEFSEQTRIIMSGSAARAMIDVLSGMCGYYPVKQELGVAEMPPKNSKIEA